MSSGVMKFECWIFLLLGVSAIKLTTGSEYTSRDAVIKALREQLRLSKDNLDEGHRRQYREQNVIVPEKDMRQLKQYSPRKRPTTAMPPTQSDLMTTGTFLPPPSSIAFLSAASSGNSTGEITLTMTYTAPPEHTTDWMFFYWMENNEYYLSTAGTRRHLHGNTYSSSATVSYQYLMGPTVMVLFGGNDTLSVYLNPHHDVATYTKMALPEVDSSVLDMRFSYVAPADGDLNLTFVVKDDAYLSSSYIGLDISRETVFTKHKYDSESITHTRYPENDGTTRVVITIKQPYAAMGGFLTIDCVALYLEGLVDRIDSGYIITILPVGRDDPVPENTVGLIDWAGTTTINGARKSIMCLAMGNPDPKVEIFIESEDGRLSEVPAELTVCPTLRMTVASYLLDPYEKQVAGKYMCRAESGNAFAETRTEVIVE